MSMKICSPAKILKLIDKIYVKDYNDISHNKGASMRKKEKNRMRLLPVFFVAVLLLTAGLSYTQKGFYMDEKKLYEKYKMSVKHFEEAKALYNKEKYEKAEKKLKDCLEVFPQHAQANFYLAHILYQASNLENALHHIEEAKKNSEFMNKMFIIGYEDYTSQLRTQRDEIQDRIQQYKDQQQRTTQSQDQQRIASGISQLQTELGTINSRLAEPLPEEKKAPTEYFYLHGNIFFKLKKYQDAHDQYVETIKHDPKHEKAYNNLINIFFMAKQYQKAMELVEHAESIGVSINPKLTEAIRQALRKQSFSSPIDG
jgi:tetratricopeptide (TPR) repeat protein